MPHTINGLSSQGVNFCKFCQTDTVSQKFPQASVVFIVGFIVLNIFKSIVDYITSEKIVLKHRCLIPEISQI